MNKLAKSSLSLALVFTCMTLPAAEFTGHLDHSVIVLTARDAAISGGARHLADGNMIGGWIDPNARLHWGITVDQAGTGSVELVYSVAPGCGGEFALAVDKQRLTGKTDSTGGWDNFQTMTLGKVNLTKGDHTVTLSAGPFATAPMNLREIRLTGVQGSVQMALTNAAQVRSLTKEQAAKPLPVNLRGVTAWSQLDDLVIVDETSGIYCYGWAVGAAGLHPGDVVEVDGITDPGHFAPYVLAQAVRKTGESKIPEPPRVTYDDLRGGSWDGQWVKIFGIVRESGPREKAFQADADWKITLSTGGTRMIITLSREQGEPLRAGAKIELRGVCFYQFNEFRQVVRPVLGVDRSERITILNPAPEEPFKLPISPIETLLEFNPQGMQGRYARVQGVATQIGAKVGFWITDGEQGAHVLTSKLDSLHLGDRVDVIGFLNCGEGFPVLEDAQFYITGKSAVVSPIRLESPEEAQKHNGALVNLDATIRSQSSTTEGCRLELEAGSNRFAALWPDQNEKSTPTTWQPGAVVRATGICIVASDTPGISPGRLPSYSLKLILRSPEDIQILRPGPWWTASRTAWVLGTVVGALLLAMSSVFGLARHRLRQQAIERMKAETEFAAVMNERNRIARELHDTLSQGLGAISLHLDVVKEQRERSPEQAARHLDIAHQTAQENLTEVRNSISNMRSHILENATLVEAVQQILRKLTEDTETQGRFTTTGSPRRLASGVENNLLRIAQEAIGNALKHAKAKTISVTLEYESGRANLIVSDDGAGFDPEHLPPGNHFGLLGQRERTIQMGGTLEIKSARGGGTKVKASIPT